MTSSEYAKQAEQFLADTGTEFSIVFLYTGSHFDDDKELRDVYQFTLKNARGMYSGKFGNSIANTEARALFKIYGREVLREHPSDGRDTLKTKRAHNASLKSGAYLPPSAYDVLACLTHYDPGTFVDFCSSYGYDEDSRKAEKTYFAVQAEWEGVRRLFTPEQLEQLQEIN